MIGVQTCALPICGFSYYLNPSSATVALILNSKEDVILPELLDALGVAYTFLNGEPTGDFAHNPEPLEKNLGGIMDELKKGSLNFNLMITTLLNNQTIVTGGYEQNSRSSYTLDANGNVKYAQTKWGTFPLKFFFTVFTSLHLGGFTPSRFFTKKS